MRTYVLLKNEINKFHQEYDKIKEDFIKCRLSGKQYWAPPLIDSVFFKSNWPKEDEEIEERELRRKTLLSGNLKQVVAYLKEEKKEP